MVSGAGPATPGELDRLEAAIDAWLADQVATNPTVTHVERGEPGERRWYVRLIGEEKGPFTVWLTLHQRTLHHETYMMPAPEEHAGALYEHLLRRNLRLRGMAFAIGAEDAVFLVGEVPHALVDEATVDAILGSTYAAVEQCFRPAMRIGFASRFRG